MTIATLYDLLPRVALDAPKCPEEVMRDALRRAWRSFCQEAEAWRYLKAISLVTGTTSYALSIPHEATIVRVDKIRLRSSADVAAGREGMPVDNDECPISGDAPNLTLSFGMPAYRVSTGSRLDVTVILVPDMGTAGAADVPEGLLREYGDAIAAKASASLCAMKGRPYHNPDVWLLRTQEYNEAKSRARRLALAGRSGRTGFMR